MIATSQRLAFWPLQYLELQEVVTASLVFQSDLGSFLLFYGQCFEDLKQVNQAK